MMNQIFVDGYGLCEVWSLPKVSPKRQRKGKYVPESFVHPAKMNVVLCRNIIEIYTKLGDIVVDPMSGIGTTLVEAVLKGRDAIGVELEQPFVGTTQKNIGLIERKRTINPKGKATVIQGDSRELSKILRGKADVAVFSPPFADSRGWKAKDYEKFVEVMRQRCKDGLVKGHYSTPEAELRHIKKAQEGAKVSHDNIGGLKYGKPVDAIVTSPPFARDKGGEKGMLVHDTKRKNDKTLYRTYTKGSSNIDNLPYGKPFLLDIAPTPP